MPAVCPRAYGGDGVRRMFRPDDEDKPFIARWNLFARILLVDTSIKLVARAAMDYADFDDGSSCHPSNERLARETGLNERTVRNAWAVMRGINMACRVGLANPHRRLADEYELQIPPNWERMPVLGPHGQKFTCPGCGKLFNPQGVCEVEPDGTVGYLLWKSTFCPAPRANKGRDGVSCLKVWNERRQKQGRKIWRDLGGDAWAVFREARGDDW